MLAELTPEEWSYHVASYRLDPTGNDWERSSMIAAALSNAIHMTASAFAGGRVDESAFIELDAFVPFRDFRDRQSERLEASLKQLESQRGLPGGSL